MAASLDKVYSNSKFKDPEWYTALAVDFLDFKWGALAKDLSKALNPDTKDTAKELRQLFVNAFNRCDAAKNYKVKTDKTYHQHFTDQQLDPEFPTYHRLFHILLNQLKEAKFKADDFSLDDHWVSELRGNFSNEFAELVRLDSEKYPAACKYIAQLKFGDSTETKVIRHINDLLYEVEQEPLAIDQQLTLHKSYVSPDCISQSVPVANRSNKESEEQESECLIGTLLDHIQDSTDPVVLHGQPGHGKTSSVKMLARTITGMYKKVAAPPITLLFEFKQLGNLNRSIVDILNQQADFITSEAFFEGKNTVVILDGLDERQAADGSSEQYLKEFVIAMFNFADKVNKKTDSRLNLIVTGRSQYVGQIKSCFSKNYTVIDIIDFNEQKQQVWLTKFNQQKRLKGDKALHGQDFKKYKLDELVSQPILLSISAIMLTDKEGQALIAKHEGQEINRAIIYHTIIEWSYEKRWHKDSHAEGWKDTLKFEDYFTLLQAIAFEMVRAGEETIKLSKLAVVLKENSKNIFDLDAIGSMELAELENLCSQLRISFFFKGVEDKAFAFIHKSFKDFLLVAGIVDAAPALLADFNAKKPDRTDSDLIALFGQKPFSEEDHSEFLLEWLSIRKGALQEFAEIANTMWLRIAEQQIKIEESVSAVHQKILSTTTFNYLQLVSRWFPMLSLDTRNEIFSRDGYVQLFSDELFKKVVLILCFYNLEHKYFSFQILSNISFKGAFYLCDFTGTYIENPYFCNCRLFNCNMEECCIQNCDLMNTIFDQCHFGGLKSSLNITEIFGHKSSSFYNCDFSKTTISVSMEDDSGYQLLFAGCQLDDATLVNPYNMDIQAVADW